MLIGGMEVAVGSDGNLWVDVDTQYGVLTPEEALELAKWITEVYVDA